MATAFTDPKCPVMNLEEALLGIQLNLCNTSRFCTGAGGRWDSLQKGPGRLYQ